MEYYSAIEKNEKNDICSNMVELEIIILSKSDRERQTSYDITYMRNLKKQTQMNLMQNRNRLTEFEKQTYAYQRRQVG